VTLIFTEVLKLIQLGVATVQGVKAAVGAQKLHILDPQTGLGLSVEEFDRLFAAAQAQLDTSAAKAADRIEDRHPPDPTSPSH